MIASSVHTANSMRRDGLVASRAVGATKILWIKPTQTSCHGNFHRRIEKLNFRLNIYSHSSTKHENLAKIGPVDFEINGLTGIVTNKYEIRNRSRTYSAPCVLSVDGLAVVDNGLYRRSGARSGGSVAERLACWTQAQ